MTTTKTKANGKEANAVVAIAKALNVPVSTKQGIEISRFLRFHSTTFAKKFLEDVIALRKPVPFVRATKDMGHKAGMSSGRFPIKTAAQFLKLIQSVEANAQVKGMNSSSLKIVHLVSNKANIPRGAGRMGRSHKSSNLEIHVKEGKVAKAASKATTTPAAAVKHVETPTVEKVETVEKSTPKVEAQKIEAHKMDVPHNIPHKTEAAKIAPKLSAVSEEYLKKVQASQAQTHKKEEKELNEVTNLYEELKKKGTLRQGRSV
ncbi:50S ribosomal protein L22 [Candidatus Woesearchaeota archaeon]|nr:50S ribosomal protein L22 [Candidatus Woesearchaeota archaeon]